MVMQRFANEKDFAKAEPVRYGREDGWFRASFRDFGSFQLMVDTVPPRISPLGFKDKMNCSKLKSIRFVVTDNTEEIKKFTATLDGNCSGSVTIRAGYSFTALMKCARMANTN